jgi:hypothetical protein
MCLAPPNSTLKPTRPVFGRAAEPPLAEHYSLGVRLVAVRFLRGTFSRGNQPAAIRVAARPPAAQLSVRTFGRPAVARVQANATALTVSANLKRLRRTLKRD